MKPIFVIPRSMKFRKLDKILFLVLLVLVFVVYGLYYWSSRQNSIQSSNKLRSIFYSTKLNDTIRRIEPIYKDDCNTSFWVANYATDYVVVDLCKYPQLRSIEVGEIIQKEKNSNECTFLGIGGKQTRINLLLMPAPAVCQNTGRQTRFEQ